LKQVNFINILICCDSMFGVFKIYNSVSVKHFVSPPNNIKTLSIASLIPTTGNEQH
jgi:hypothetical protein